jgi:chemotaxis protein CheD
MSRSTHFLQPGEILFSEQAMIVTTVLGSCVSIILQSKDRRFWSINHATLPSKNKLRDPVPSAGLYVDSGLERMLANFLQQGYLAQSIEARLFGGGDVISRDTSLSSSHVTIGQQNNQMALQQIEQSGLTLISRDAGGPTGRKLVFYSGSGNAYLKYISTEQKKECKKCQPKNGKYLCAQAVGCPVLLTRQFLNG